MPIAAVGPGVKSAPTPSQARDSAPKPRIACLEDGKKGDLRRSSCSAAAGRRAAVTDIIGAVTSKADLDWQGRART